MVNPTRLAVSWTLLQERWLHEKGTESELLRFNYGNIPIVYEGLSVINAGVELWRRARNSFHMCWTEEVNQFDTHTQFL